MYSPWTQFSPPAVMSPLSLQELYVGTNIVFCAEREVASDF